MIRNRSAEVVSCRTEKGHLQMVRPRSVCVWGGGCNDVNIVYIYENKKLKGIILNSQRINKILKNFKLREK